MCDCDLEPPTLYQETIRKARKIHQCCECKHNIEQGDSYVEIKGMWDRKFSTFKTCLECKKIGDKLECFGLGMLYETLIDCEHLVPQCDEDGEPIENERKQHIYQSAEDWLEVVSQSPLKSVIVICCNSQR